MLHSILVATVFVAMVLTPCVIAMFSGVDETDNSTEANALEDGFI